VDTGRLGICTHDYVSATITGNTFYKTTDDFGYAIEMGSQSTGVIRDNTIYGYDTPAASDGSNSAGIYIENAFTGGTSGVTKTVLLDNNEVYGCQWALYVGNEFDTYAGDVDINVTLNDNDFHDNVDGGAAITDEDKEDGSSVSVSGGGNTLTNNGGYGYYIFSAGDGDITVSLADEIVTGHDKGVYVEDTGSPSTSSYNVAITMSDISSNTTAGIDNTVSGLTLDAECNWWGNLRGPYHPTGNPSGTGNSVSDDVDFQPWLTQAAPSGCDHDGPLAQNVGPGSVAVNTAVVLTANVGDTGTGGTVIASAEYNLDGGSWAPMQAQDGSFFDDVSEGVTATIPAFTDTDVHVVCVQGTDAAGNTGAAKCAWLAVYYRAFLPLSIR
jgi:hypothetical protein